MSAENTINELKMKPQKKLKIMFSFIHSEVLLEIMIYDFSLMWVEQNLDAGYTFHRLLVEVDN